MDTHKAEPDILIAGAGPTGLALAAQLTRLDMTSLIIDRQAAGANTSRACVVHARTMEVLEPLGVTRNLPAEGVKVPTFRIRDRDRTPMTVDFGEIPSPYPFTLMIPQDRVERCLLRHLEQLGGRVVRPCELISCKAMGTNVEVTLRSDDARETVRPSWLVGCDDMHSTVRDQTGIPFTGVPTQKASFLPTFTWTGR